MTRRAGRWWGSAGLALFAGLATVSGLDRSTEDSPAAARFVPQMFGSQTARGAAAQALEKGDIATAEAWARLAIDADPLDRRGPAYLAAAQAMAGLDEEAERGFALSNTLSRREPLTQSYLYGSAMERGDYRAAARQVDILLRAHPEFPAAQQFVSQLEAVPAGRAALLDRLIRNPAWANAYLEGHGTDDNAFRIRAETMTQEAGVTALGCERSALTVRALEGRNLFGAAGRLHDAHCPAAPQERGFRDMGQGWHRHLAGDVQFGSGGGPGRPVTLSSRASVTRLMLSQPVALAPGEYRISARVDGVGAERVVASLTCAEAGQPARGGDALVRGQILDAQPCDDLVIGIWLRPGAGTVALGDLRIEPVGRQPQSRP